MKTKDTLRNLEERYRKLVLAREILEDQLHAARMAATEIARELLEVSVRKQRYEDLLHKAEKMIIDRNKEIELLRGRLEILENPKMLKEHLEMLDGPKKAWYT